jgi:protein involved in polysaccharide export with SLBB domain
MVAMLVLSGCLQIPSFAQTTLTTPLDEQQVRTPLPKEGPSGTPSADRRVPLQSTDSNSLESAPGKNNGRLPGLPETLAVPEPAEPVTEFQEFVASSLGRKLPIYGHSLFNHVPTTFAPVDRIPVTDDYLIGPGDEVLIRAWGQIDLDGKLVVDREGEVFLPKVGALSVAGLKYQQLPEFFRTAIGRVFRNFDLTVSLGQLRSIQVFVVGQARHPGNYTVSSLSTLVNALFASGGPSASGSMRRIQLKRNNLVVTEFDFYDLLLNGDKSKDARLLPGDVIYIPPTGPSIAMAGSVNVPAIYELRDGTTLAGAVEMAGGLATTADGQKAVVERIENHDTRRVEEFPLDQQGWVRPLKDGDVVRIFPLSPRFQNAVTLRGNVAHPGRVEWHRGMRLRDLIPNQEALITRDYWSTTNGGAHSELPRNPRDNWSPAHANAQPEFTHHPNGTRPADMSSTTDGTTDVAPATEPTPPGDTSPKTDLLRTAPEINWDYAVIQRLNPQNLTPQLVPFNLGKLVLEGDEQNNLALEPGDTVIIFSQNDIAVPTEKRSAFLRLEGEFRTAGVFRAETGETLRHLVERVGGYTNNGNLIGDTVGRMGRAIQFWFTYWISPQNALQFTYKHNTVNQRFVPQGGAWQDYSLRHELYLHSGLYVKSQLQYEHISRYPLLFPGPQRNVTAIVELGFVPHKSK